METRYIHSNKYQSIFLTQMPNWKPLHENKVWMSHRFVYYFSTINIYLYPLMSTTLLNDFYEMFGIPIIITVYSETLVCLLGMRSMNLPVYLHPRHVFSVVRWTTCSFRQQNYLIPLSETNQSVSCCWILNKFGHSLSPCVTPAGGDEVFQM